MVAGSASYVDVDPCNRAGGRHLVERNPLNAVCWSAPYQACRAVLEEERPPGQ